MFEFIYERTEEDLEKEMQKQKKFTEKRIYINQFGEKFEVTVTAPSIEQLDMIFHGAKHAIDWMSRPEQLEDE